jgi:hypothetical protein
MTWHTLLWISPHVVLAVVAVLLYQRRLYREFPCFLVYTLFEIGEFALLFALNSIPSATGQQYTYAFIATLVISIALRFGVIREVSDDLFRERQFLKEAARGSLRWTWALLVLIGILCAIYAPGEDGARVIGGLAVINRGVAIIQCGLLIFLMCFSRLLGLSWRRFAFGIALGVGVLSSVDVATYAIRAQVVSDEWARALNLLTTGSYLICSLIWLGYILAPERKRSVVTNVSGDEVNNWNSELQRWLSS